jgi:hypothetical protein
VIDGVTVLAFLEIELGQQHPLLAFRDHADAGTPQAVVRGAADCGAHDGRRLVPAVLSPGPPGARPLLGVALDGDPALTLPASGLLPVTIATTPPVITRTLLVMARITGTLAGRTVPRGADIPGIETSQMRPASAGPGPRSAHSGTNW